MLFEDILPGLNASDSPEDNTQITQILLYYDEPDAREFKRLCKAGMLSRSGTTPLTQANICTFLLTLLKETYGTINSEASSNGQARPQAEEELP